MKWTVEYKRVEAITIEARNEEEALKLAQDTDVHEFEIVDSEWSVFEEDNP